MLSNIIDNSSVSIYSIEYLQGLADRFEVDEIYILNDQGEIISGTRKEYIGLNLDSGEQMSYFKPMLTDKKQAANSKQKTNYIMLLISAIPTTVLLSVYPV